MKIGSANPAWRWLFFLATLLVAATLAFLSGKNWMAEKWAQSSQSEDWLRAAQLESGNADHWYRLGRYRQLDFERMDPVLAISYYRRALAINPRSATSWLDLAGAHEMTGEVAQAREAFENAKSVYPISSEVAWRYGNFLLRQGQVPEAFAEIHRAVATDPKLAPLAISRCWRSTRDIKGILDQALPAQTRVYLPALDFLVDEHEDNAALAVWRRLLALHSSFELLRAFPLLDQMIRQDRIEDAKRVWQEALGAAGWTQPELVPGSLIWDGGFEGQFANGGFGWRQREVDGASFEYDTETRHAGTRSLRVTFDGTANVDLEDPKQYVLVEASRRYRLAAYLRTEGITTNSGVRLMIRDPKFPGDLNILTPNVVGTQPWALEEVDFTTGRFTHLVEIALRRVPSEKFDNKIQGTVWIDEVSLIPLPQEGPRRAP